MDGYGGNAQSIAAALAARTLTSQISNPLTAMGRVATAEATPLIRWDFTYGLPTGAFVTTNSSGTGTVEGQRGYGEVKTGGTAAGAYATMFSPRPQRFRDGQGTETYFTVKFDSPQAGAVQLVGAFTSEDGFGLGYGNDPLSPPYDADFKVHRKSNALRQIETLTLSGASGAGTVDIALSGAGTVTVSLTASTLAQNAAEIAAETYPGWRALNLDDTVIFVRDSTGPVSVGTYASASGSPATGAFAITTTGDNGSEEWIPQSSWNIDSLDGSGPSGQTLNPQHWNQFGLRWTDTYCEWFWFAPDGNFYPFHRVVATTDVLISNSSLPLQATAYNISSVSSPTTLRVCGAAGSNSGRLDVIGARRSRTVVTAAVGTVPIPLVSYRLAAAYAGPNSPSPRAFTGLVEFILAGLGNDGNRGGFISVVINADLDKPPWTTVAGINSSAVREAVGGSFVTPGTPGGVTILAEPITRLTSAQADLERLATLLLRGQTLTFVGQAYATTTELAVTPTWVEQR